MSRSTILGVGIAVLGLWLGSSWAVTATISSWEVRGQFGDMFGALNSLFSGLAFAGIVVAILIQRAELQLQREELRLAREEQQRMVAAQQDASRSLDRQFPNPDALGPSNAASCDRHGSRRRSSARFGRGRRGSARWPERCELRDIRSRRLGTAQAGAARCRGNAAGDPASS